MPRRWQEPRPERRWRRNGRRLDNQADLGGVFGKLRAGLLDLPRGGGRIDDGLDGLDRLDGGRGDGRLDVGRRASSASEHHCR